MLLLLWSCNHNNREIESQPFNDSIKKYLDLASNDTLPFKIRDSYNQKAFSFIDLSKNDTLVRWYLYLNSRIFFKLNDLKKLKESTDVLFEKATKSKDSNKIVSSYRLYDKYYTLSSINDSAIYYCFKAKRYYEKIKDNENLALIYFDISIILNYESDFLGSNKYAFLGLKCTKKPYTIRILKTQIASNLSVLHEYENSNRYYEEALEVVFKNRQLNKSKFVVWCDISSNLIDNKKYKQAIYYLKKVLGSKEAALVNPENFALANDLFAHCKLKLGDYNGLPKLFFKSEKIRKDNFIENGSNYNKIYLSEYYSLKKDTLKAIHYAREAIKISKQFKNPNDILSSIEQLIRVDRLKSKKEIQEYIRINDSLKIAERLFRDKFSRIEYETEEISQEKERAVKQKWIISSIITGILIIVLLLFVVFRQKTRQKELQLLQDQQKANEEIYQLLINQHVKEEEARQNEKKRIALELHDNVMNQLASTRFNLYAISQNTDKETIEKALSHIDKIKDIENEIRTITHNLSNDIFTGTYNFKSILEKLIDEQNKTYSTHYKLELDANIDWEVISGKLKMNLYRILQELIYNINKHAQATFSVISIVLDNNNICMAVQDNGKGFVVSESANGIGMKNIEQRLKEVQGKINVRSSIGNGTNVFITIPV